MEFKKNLALIGVGYWGKNLARNFHKLGSLHTICDIDETKIKQYCSQYTDVNFETSLKSVLENPEITKVAIAAPTNFHYDIASEAIKHGKDVFVEKAMCLNSAQALKLAQLADEYEAILMVGHILQYHPCINYLKEMIDDGKLGTIHHLTFSRLNFGSMGEEKSAMWAFAPHDVSVLLRLCDHYTPSVVQCRNKSFFSKNHLDQSWIHLDFLENVSADIHVNWVNPFPERKLTIIGSEGTAIFDDLKGWGEKITFWKNSVLLESGKLVFNQNAAESMPVEPKEPLHEECKHFLKCCHDRTQPISNGWEGFNVMRILGVAQKSAQLNQSLVVDQKEQPLVVN